MLHVDIDHSSPSASSTRQSPLADDIFTFRYITKQSTRDFELGLFQTKWFDYRMLTPLEATWQFIRDYEVVYREVYAQMLDRERANFVQPLTEEKIRNGMSSNPTKMKRYLSSCWRARQVADAAGMPYKQYIRLTMDARLRNWKRTTLPQPSQLYTDYVVEKAVARWEEIKLSRLFKAEHKAFKAESYCGVAYQDEYHEWLISQALLRQHSGDLIIDMLRAGELPYEKTLARLPETIRQYVNERH